MICSLQTLVVFFLCVQKAVWLWLPPVRLQIVRANCRRFGVLASPSQKQLASRCLVYLCEVKKKPSFLHIYIWFSFEVRIAFWFLVNWILGFAKDAFIHRKLFCFSLFLSLSLASVFIFSLFLRLYFAVAKRFTNALLCTLGMH